VTSVASRRLWPSRVRTWLVTAVCSLLAVADVLSLWRVSAADTGSLLVIPASVLGAGFAASAGVALRRRPATRAAVLLSAVGLLLLSTPLFAVGGAEFVAAIVGATAIGVLAPWGLLSVVPVQRAQVTQRVLLGAQLGSGLALVGSAGLGGSLAITLSGLTCAVVLFCAGWFQFELTAAAERRQLLWLILGVCTSIPVCSLFLVAADKTALNPAWVGLIASLLTLPLPLSAGVALVGPDHRDVRALISRIVLHVVLLTLALSLFVTCAASLQALNGGPVSVGLLGVVAALIAAAYHPILLQARGTIDELLFGGRADPVITLGRLGDQLTSGVAPEQWLESLRSALAVPSLVLRRGQDVLAAAGDPTGAETTSIELRVGDEVAGELVVALPPGQMQLPPTTRAVLQLVAAPLAQALQAAHLSEQLLRSRGHVVGVLEEERRRMRRDLHDGLGPTLTGVAYSADAAANSIASDPGKAAALLQDLRADVGEAIAEIRRIVYGLRPKALDELGLVGAVMQRVDRLLAPDGQPFTVSCASSPLPDLPAAVEVVAYRVAVEAVTNVARHAAVHQAHIDVRLDGPDLLEVVVTDQGTSTRPWHEGVGIASMRERVDQIGAPSKQPRAPRAVESTPNSH